MRPALHYCRSPALPLSVVSSDNSVHPVWKLLRLLSSGAPSEFTQTLLISTLTYKRSIFTASDQFHSFMTLRTAGIRRLCDSLPVSAFPILTYKHPTIFAIYSKQTFSTIRTKFVCHIVMPKSSFRCLDLFYQIR